MDVADVLRDRMAEPKGLERMATISVLAHGAIIAVLLLAPSRWLTRPAEAPRTIMTITLGGGAPGPQNGGISNIGGRPVQQQLPPDAPKPREAVQPPAAKPPEMIAPAEKPRPTKAAPPVTQAPEQARGRTPTKGPETREGNAVAETGARGQGFGLATGGRGGLGSSLDVENFCCPDYLVTMTERVRSNWNAQQEVAGNTVIRFTIERDGRIANSVLEKSSGYTALDLAAQRAIEVTRQLAPLPAQFPNQTLTVHLNFSYTR